MKNKKMILALVALVALVGIAVGIFIITRPGSQEGMKTITLEIVHSDGSKVTKTIKTSEEYLDKALIAQKLITGYDGQYGFVVESVDGETADWSNNVFWAIYINGESSNYGISQIPVTDGACYKLVYESYSA